MGNVVHLFFFFCHHFELLKSAYLLAQDTEQNFPLACVAINITRMCMDCLFRGKLTALCNTGKGVFDTTCRVFSGGLFHFYSRWRSLKRTIRDTELTFQEVRALMEKKPARLISGLAKGVEEQKAKSDPGRFEFTDLDFGGARGPPKAQTAAPQSAPTKSSAAKPSVPSRLKNYHDASGG